MQGSSGVSEAARAIGDADILLLHLGAGMSADSGLAVFINVADVECYRQRNLSYIDLSTATWLADGQPEVFYGFWGASFNNYRRAVPHLGYDILRKWKDTICFGRDSPTARKLRLLSARAGPSFVYTSNIDGFALRSGLASEEQVFEYHGDTETWQCSGPCCKKLFRAPKDYVFDVDPDTMMGLPKPADYVPPLDALDDNRYQSTLDPSCFQSPLYTQQAFSGPFPHCPDCGKHARPSILMFNSNDTTLWVRRQSSEDNWNSYREALTGALRQAPGKVVIVEIGAGVNVPSLRFQSERMLSTIVKEHRSCPAPTLIRINPDHPELQDAKLGQQAEFIGIQMRALPALQAIDEIVEQQLLDALC